MGIKIIGEKHYDEDSESLTDEEYVDKKFTDFAKQLAKENKIILVLENEVFDDYQHDGINGLMKPNIYAIEDKVIFGYNSVLMALYYACLEDMNEYFDSYYAFLNNFRDGNPIELLIKELFDMVIQEGCLGFKGSEDKNPLMVLFESCREKWADKIKNKGKYEQEICFLKENLQFFNNVLKISAKLFAKYISRSDKYSDKIKAHAGINESWIDDYFSFKFFHLGRKNILNFDVVCVDLRNQFFVDRLCALSRELSNFNRNIWFIVGQEHLSGLKQLFQEQCYGVMLEIIPRCKKHKLIFNSDLAIRNSPILLPPFYINLTQLLPDGRRVHIANLSEAACDGDCGFRSILGKEFLMGNFERSSVIQLFSENLSNEIVRNRVTIDLKAKYQEFIAGHSITLLPVPIQQQFKFFHTQAQQNAHDVIAQNILNQQIEQYCSDLAHLNLYITQYLNNKDNWPHLQGSLVAFAYLNRIKLHCFQVMPSDLEHPIEWLHYVDDMGQPTIQGYYPQEIFIIQNLERTHFDRLEVEIQ